MRKDALLNAIAGTRQGRVVEERPRVNRLIADLEKVNPTPQPLAAPAKLTAKWRLLYTTSDSILGSTRPALFQPRPLILQHIDATNLQAKNEEWILGGLVKNSVRAELTPQRDGKSVNVRFYQFRIGPFPINVPERDGRFRNALKTTYLDDDLRISRGDKGNLFVLERYGDVSI